MIGLVAVVVAIPATAMAQTSDTEPPVSTTAVPAPPCVAAAALADAGRFAEALALYGGVAAPCPGRPEAVAAIGGQQAVAESLAREGQAAVDAGDDAEAQRLFVEALAQDPQNETATAGLVALVDGAEDDHAPANPFALAERLLAAGFDDAAREAAIEAMESGDAEPPAALTRELDDERGIGDRVDERWSSLLDWLTTPLAWVVLGALLLAGLASVLRHQRRTGGWLGGTWPATALYRASVEFEEGKGDGADIVGAEMRHVLKRLRTSADGGSVRYVTAAAAALDDLPDPSDLDARLKPIKWLGDVLQGRDRIRVTPFLEAPDTGTKELVIEVSAKKDVDDRFPRSGRFATPGPRSVLAGRAAGWFVFELHRIRPHTAPLPDATRFGVDSSTAFGALLGGLEAIRAGDQEEARRQFQEATSADDHAFAPQLNLAATEVSSYNPYVIACGIRRLERLL